jgi:hypothetical protein
MTFISNQLCQAIEYFYSQDTQWYLFLQLIYRSPLCHWKKAFETFACHGPTYCKISKVKPCSWILESLLIDSGLLSTPVSDR